MQAFQFSIFSDPRLADLRDPNAPLHNKLVNDAFYTVNAQTKEQRRGRDVFEKNCMTCHNTPNVFNNLTNTEALGNGVRPPNFPTFAPAVPQLRGVKDAGPYFHDNSMATLEDVVDYFNSDEYNRSADGKNFPIHMSRKERSDLLEFLQIL
ncbi:Di-heme cytochrome c peroxidase family protein [Labilithrix luteola]|uniref:Di-heme cytochrome c peroxidase family protein n=1 Tax=Labilithrix luteola TaxID=1391654 RepID=A0A0K1PV04_9BACT|nr:c-type cytochrome [Labilithrix luteola]AKU97363.1 Di-heme cytochrome c peroxidase family protein [Labilithrix luteola]